MNLTRQGRYTVLLLALAIILCTVIYSPGLSGPWMFDDYTNILYNNYIHISKLDSSSLYHAAFTFESGPLKRPISMLTFALNHYYSGGLDSTSFKVTNLVIHAV